ncbi:ribosome maturation factor RimM [Paucibacter sp. O1-1]|nr:ribosome maturation factor RimM [Paucibacter sp. M5-1]MCU7369677.1 ribosome maturation factor RimM [Paucibacter sp. O1-1]MCZ7883643.1 ribosome maturation factor RimM [Paucibacter sp. M5-1]MDA3824661.1 ribosome maturation factor RimM [Paucibacter sp. O1-1]
MSMVSETSRASAAGSNELAWPDDAIEIGRVLDAWGVKGWIKVLAYSNDPQALFSSRRWFLKPSEENNKPAAAVAAKARALPPVLKVLSVREHGDGIVANVQDVSDRSGAEALRGARIFVSRSTFPKVDTDEYYWVDLIGLTVVNRAGETLGVVADLIDAGPHSVLRITPPGLTPPIKPDQERLVPFVSAFVDDVNLDQRRITVDWGLDY